MINKLISKIMKEGGRSSIVKKNIIGSIGIRGLSIAISFALVPLTIGYVSSELYGVWLTLSSILVWLSFLDIGFSQGLKNKLTEAITIGDWGKGKALVSTTYFMMFLIFCPLCLLLEILAPFINWCSLLNISDQYSSEILKTMHILIAMFCLQMIVNVFVSVVAAFQKVALSNAFTPIGNFISLIIIYILTKTSPPSLSSLAYSLAAMPILVTIIASIVLFSSKFKKVSPNIFFISFRCVKDLFSLGYKFFIINIQVLVVYQSTNVLISNISSPIEVTAYNIAYKLMNVAMMFYTIIIAPLWPAYTEAYTKGDYDWMRKMKQKMRKILLCSIAGCAIITLCSPIIYDLWIGKNAEIPFMMTVFVAVYVSAFCWNTLNGTLVVGIGKIKMETTVVIIGMFLHIPLSFLFGKYIGAYGVILSMILINIFYGIIYSIQVKKILTKTATGIWNE